MDPSAVDQSIMGLIMQQPVDMNGGGNSQLNNLYKTQLCKHYQQTKQCHVGKRCHFAHGDQELRKREEPLPVEVTLRMMNIPYNNYKTQTCKNFEREGKCKFGEKCSYAHGNVDMRNPYESILLPNTLAPQQLPHMNPKQNALNQSNNNVQLQPPQFAHTLQQQINNYSIPSHLQSPNNIMPIQAFNQTNMSHPLNSQVYNQRPQVHSLSPTNRHLMHQQIQSTNSQNGLNIFPQSMMINGNSFNQAPIFSAQRVPTNVQRHMSDHVLMQNQQFSQHQMMGNQIQATQNIQMKPIITGNVHLPIHQQQHHISPSHVSNQQFNMFHSHNSHHLTQPVFQSQNTFMISPRNIAELSPMEPLKNKSLSVDNSITWSNSLANTSKSTTNKNLGGFTSTSLNTAFASSNGNGFNYMLINPAVYDEDTIEEQMEESSYHLPSSLALSVPGGSSIFQ